MLRKYGEVSPSFIKDLLEAPLNKDQQDVVDDLVEMAGKSLIEAAVDGHVQLVFPEISKHQPKIIDAWVRAMKKKGFKVYRYATTPFHRFIQLDGS